MSLRNCFPDLLAKGQITAEQSDEMLRNFEDLRRQRAGQYGESAADAMAGEAVLKALAHEKALQKRQALLQAAAQGKISMFVRAAAEAGRDPVRAAKGVLGYIPGVNGFQSVEATFDAIWRLATGNNAVLFEKYGASLFRGQITTGKAPADLVRALFGEAVDDPAIAGMAKALAETFEYLRLRFNAAGGTIGRLENWGLPQAHDWLKVRDAGYDAWRQFILPKLDTGQMIDGLTGQPFAPERLELALRDVWESIRTGGWNDREAGMQGLGKLANRRGDPRFLKFASSDAWMEYQARFGNDDVWGTITGHLHGMARDIAAMEVLGPNPQQTVQWLQGTLEKDLATGQVAGKDFDRLASKVGQGAAEIGRMWDAYTGTANAVAGQRLADFGSGTRAFLTAAHLGGATISAITDPLIQLFNRAYNGLPMMEVFSQSLGFLNPANADDRIFAAQLGAGMDDAIGHSIALLRYTGEATVNGRMQWAAAAVLRVSGLNFWTEAQKRASAWGWSGHLARERGKGFAELSEAMQASFQRHGISPDEWDAIRSTEPVMRGGAPFLKPGDIYANPAIGGTQADALVTKLLGMIVSEEKNSVIQASLRSRAVASAGGKRGTAAGEAWRSIMQFKQFPLEIMLRSLGRLVHDTSRPASAKLAYAAMFPALTLAGGMILQLKALAAGKDPQAMRDNPKFWIAAAAQGGGLGLFGDFLFSDTGRYGRSFAETALGPTVGLVGDLKDFVQGNLAQAVQGEETNAGREAVKLLRRYAPGTKLWYIRLAWDRHVNDQLQRMIDPDYQAAFDRTAQRADELYGQPYWWRPGEDAADRAPDLARAFEESEQ